MSGRSISLTRWSLALGTGLLLLLAAGCGGTDEQGAAREAPTGQTTGRATAPEARGGQPAAKPQERPRAGGNGAPSPQAHGEAAGGNGPGGCEYTAPPGRLGEGAVKIELTGASCDERRRLALAAALGQPAGANLPVRRDGFDCEPSTRERGVDVTYSCTKASQRARFAISWGGEQ